VLLPLLRLAASLLLLLAVVWFLWCAEQRAPQANDWPARLLPESCCP
jgi:hypothetical protein